MTALPPKAELDGSSSGHNQGVFKAAIGGMRDFLSGLFGADGTPATALATMKLLDPQAVYNLSPVFTVDSNALTCTLKDRAGNDLGSGNAGFIGQRSATGGDGGFNLRAITANVALTISSGSTLGHASGAAGKIYWYLLDNAGAQVLAASSEFKGLAGRFSTTAEGGAGAADSGTALYAIAAHSNLPGRLIAVTTDTQTTAGTWVALPSLVQAAPFDQDIFFPAAAAFAGPGIKQGYGISNNVSDATNDIDIAAGKAVDSTGAVVMSGGAQTKRLDADWAPGSGNGGRYSGAAITNGTYHVWKIAKAGGADVDSYLDPSADVNTVLGHVQAESGGASYLYAWRIGSIMRESATLVPFVQIYDLFMRKTPILDVSAAGVGTSAVLRTLSVPAGLKVQAEFFAYYRNTSGSPDGCNMYFTDPDLTDLAPNMTLSPGTAPGGDGSTLDTRMGAVNFIYTNTSRQVRSRVGATGGSITLYMVTRGWRDPAIYRS